MDLTFITLGGVLLAQCRDKHAMTAGSKEYAVKDAGILTIIGTICASQLQLFKGVVAPSTTDLMKVLEFTFSGISKTQSHKIDIINSFIYNLFALCSLCPSNLVYTTLKSTDKKAIIGSFDGDKFSLKIPIHAYNALYKEKNLTIKCKQITKQIYIGGEISEECSHLIRSKIERLLETRNNFVYEIEQTPALVLERYPDIVKIDRLILALNILLIFTEENPELILNCTIETGWGRVRYETLAGRGLILCIEKWTVETINRFMLGNPAFFAYLEAKGQQMKPRNTLAREGKYIDLLIHYNEVKNNFQITLDAYMEIIRIDDLPPHVTQAKSRTVEVIGGRLFIHWHVRKDIKIVVDWYNRRNALKNSEYVLRVFIFLIHATIYHTDGSRYPLNLGDHLSSRVQTILSQIVVLQFVTTGDANRDWDELSKSITPEIITFDRIDLILEMIQIYEEYIKSMALFSLDELYRLPEYGKYINLSEYSGDETGWYIDLMTACSFHYNSDPRYKTLQAPFVRFGWTEAIAIQANTMIQSWKKYNKYFNSQVVFDAYKVVGSLMGPILRGGISIIFGRINIPGFIQRVIGESFASTNLSENIKHAINVSLNAVSYPQHMRDAVSASFNMTQFPPETAQGIIDALNGANLPTIVEEAINTSFVDMPYPDNIQAAIGSLIDTTLFDENLQRGIIASLDDIHIGHYIKEGIAASFRPENLTANIRKWVDKSISEDNDMANITLYVQRGIIESFDLPNIPANIQLSVVASFRTFNFAANIPVAMTLSTNWNKLEELETVVDWYRRYSDNMENISKIVAIYNESVAVGERITVTDPIDPNIATRLAVKVDEVDELMRLSYVENNTPPPNLELAYTFARDFYITLPLQIQQAYENSYRPNCTGNINWARPDSVNLVVNWYNNSDQVRMQTAYTEAARLIANLSPEVQAAMSVSFDGRNINWARTDAIEVVMNWYKKYLFYTQNANVPIAYTEAARLFANLSPEVQAAMRVSYDGTNIILARTDAIEVVVNWCDKYTMYQSQNEEVSNPYEKLVPLIGRLPPEVQAAIRVSFDGTNINWARTDAIEVVVNWYEKYNSFNEAYTQAATLYIPPEVQAAMSVSFDGTNINWARTDAIEFVLNWYDKYKLLREAYTEAARLFPNLHRDTRLAYNASVFPTGHPNAGSFDWARTDAIKIVLNWYDKYRMYQSRIEEVIKAYAEMQPLSEYFPLVIKEAVTDSIITEGNPGAGTFNFARTDAIEKVMQFFSEIELYKKIHRAILALKEYLKTGKIPIMTEEVRIICERIEASKVIDYTSDTVTNLMDWYNSDYYRFVVVTEFNKTLIRINGYRRGIDNPSVESVIEPFVSVTGGQVVNVATIDWSQVENINIVLQWNSVNIGPVLFGGHRKKNSGSKKSKKMKIVKSKKNKLVKKRKTIKKRKILKKIKKTKKIKLIKSKTIKRK